MSQDFPLPKRYSLRAIAAMAGTGSPDNDDDNTTVFGGALPRAGAHVTWDL